MLDQNCFIMRTEQRSFERSLKKLSDDSLNYNINAHTNENASCLIKSVRSVNIAQAYLIAEC